EDRRADRRQVEGVGEQRLEVLEPDEARLEPEGVLHEEGLPECLARRPDEEDQGNGELRGEERVRQPGRTEPDALPLRSAAAGTLHGCPIRLSSRSGAAARCPVGPPCRGLPSPTCCPPRRPPAPRRSRPGSGRSCPAGCPSSSPSACGSSSA